VKAEKDDLVADSHSVLARWRKHFFQLWNVHGFNDVTHTEIHATEPLVPELSAFEFELAIEKLKSHSIKTDNSSLERVVEFKYLGTTLTNQNSMQEEIKSRLKSGNAWYRSVQNLLSSRLQSKNLKIKIYGTIILPITLYGCETW